VTVPTVRTSIIIEVKIKQRVESTSHSER